MHSLPIFETVSRTFGFVIERRFFSLLRLIWLPVFLSVAVGTAPALYQFAVMGFPPDPAKAVALNSDPIFHALSIVNFVASLVLSAMIAISVHRMILVDDRQPGTYFYWRFTREEMLYILAWLGYLILVMLAIMLPFVAHFYYISTHETQKALTAVTAFTQDPAKNAAVLKNALSDPRLIFVGILSATFALVALARFGLVFPIIVAEGQLSFWRSWQLTRGNTLPLIGFWIVVVILTYVVVVLLVAVALAAMVGIFAAFAGGQTAGALGTILLAVPAAISLVMYLVIGITMFIAAMSFSYKALAGETAATTDAFA